MKQIVKIIPVIIAGIFLLSLKTSISAAKGGRSELIQMAILLDTSNSMDGLITQAKSQLWKIVNELALTKKNGKKPRLEVALYEYGKQSIPSKQGYLRMIVPLTSDLDSVSDELFKLRTNGGDEYCGMVINTAANSLKWTNNNGNLKVIFIAGNEPFTQGNFDYKEACRAAISKGIIVNTIFCGDHNTGIKTKWKHGSELADGKYISINQNKKIVHIKAPQDEEIMRLGNELNRTYFAYTSSGKVKKMRQQRQDTNAASMSEESLVQRSLAKASVQYENSEWDLVDAVQNKRIELDKIKDKDLPDEMKNMNDKERKEYVEKQFQKRKKIQARINKLNKERRKYIEKEIKKRSDEETLDSAIINSIRKQAKAKNFIFE